VKSSGRSIEVIEQRAHVRAELELTMHMRLEHLTQRAALALCGLILTTLLLACGSVGSSYTTPTQPATSSTSSSSSSAMATLTGNGFSMSYPQNWHITRSGSHLVTLANSTNTEKLIITTIPDPKGSISAQNLADVGLKAASVALKNAQPEPVPATTMVGGESWGQKSVSGMQRLNNQDAAYQVVVLTNVHPGNAVLSKGYTINYGAAKSTFSQASTAYFQPMLQSFKFV
jgi:hypothetical protein